MTTATAAIASQTQYCSVVPGLIKRVMVIVLDEERDAFDYISLPHSKTEELSCSFLACQAEGCPRGILLSSAALNAFQPITGPYWKHCDCLTIAKSK